MPRKESIPRKIDCAECGGEFSTTHSMGKFCSDRCRRLGARKNWKKYADKNRADRRKAWKFYYEKNKKKCISERQARIYKEKKIKPQIYKARNALNNAVKSGKIIRNPCKKCGSKKVDAHHPDYSKPLKVIWLCRSCHAKEHLKDRRKK